MDVDERHHGFDQSDHDLEYVRSEKLGQVQAWNSSNNVQTLGGTSVQFSSSRDERFNALLGKYEIFEASELGVYHVSTPRFINTLEGVTPPNARAFRLSEAYKRGGNPKNCLQQGLYNY